jgi:LCP family protein required for cell wall assembly
MPYGSRRDDPQDWGRGQAGWDREYSDDQQGYRTGSSDHETARYQAEPGGSRSSRRAAGASGRRGGSGRAGSRRAGSRRAGRGSAGSWKPASLFGLPIRLPFARSAAWTAFRSKSWLAQVGYTAVVLSAALIVAAGVTTYAIYQHLDGNITRVQVKGLSGKTIYGALNILVLGSQERAGQTGFNFGYESDPEVENSDNLLLIHLDPTHTHATVISIPRDLYVYEPGCQARPQTGTGIWGPYDYPPGALIDGALNIGGPSCAVATVEALTGITLDHVIVFDFNSFRTMVDALGGVEVCVPPGAGYHDGYSHLNLSPGLHKVTYNEALAYVRTRHGVGSGVDEGGDLPRIELQQAFISSVVQQVDHEGLLNNLGALLKIANIATKALTVDQNLGSVPDLIHLAESLAHLRSKDVNLITLPTTMDTYDYPDPTYADHLMMVQPQDDVLFQMARLGQQWQGELPTQPYHRVAVQVLNGTGQTGLAAKTAAALKELGFDVTSIGDAPYTSTTTVSYAGLDQADYAYTLMTALKSWPAAQNTLAEPASQIGSPGTIILTLGADWAGVNPPPAAAPAPSPTKASKKSKHGKKTASPAPGGSSVAVSQSIQENQGAVQSRNAGSSICSGLPPAYTPGAQGPG